jgi:hypothetical protein
MEKIAPNGTGLVSATIGATVTIPALIIGSLPALAAGDYLVATITSEAVPTGGVGSVVKVDTIDAVNNKVNIVASLAETVAGKTLNSNLALVGSATPVSIVFDASATAVLTRPTQRTVNNAVFLTEGAINQATTNIVVPAAQRSLFADVDLLGLPSAMYRLTLDDGTNNEIVIVVGYDPLTGSMEIARGAEGTLANIFAIGTTAEIRLTAGLLEKKTEPTPESVYSAGTDVTLRGIAKTVIDVAGGGVKIGDVSATNALLNGIAIGTGALSSTDTIAIGHGSSAPSAGKAVAIGTNATAADIRSVVIGQGANAAYSRSTIIGYLGSCTDNRTAVVGAYAKAHAYKTTALGDYAEALALRGTAVGQFAQVTSAASLGTAVGQYARVLAPNGTAIGQEAFVDASATSAIALGTLTKAYKPRTISTGYARPMLYYNRTANNAPASALEANSVSLVAGSTIYVGSGIGMGILPDDVTVHLTNVVGSAAAPPVFTLDTQAVGLVTEDNEVVAALTNPVTIGTLGANLLSDNTFDKINTGFPANKPIKGVRLTLTTPPVGITSWNVHLIVRGVLISIT